MERQPLKDVDFDALGTIGLEEEFFVVHRDNLKPVNNPKKFLSNPPDELGEKLETELFRFVVETQIDKCWNVEDAFSEVRSKRKILKSHAKSHGYALLAGGLHPSANWKLYDNVDSPEYYANQLERIQYPQHRNITAGLHIHIGIDDADKAVWIYNEIRRFLPLILAVSSNSPFWKGEKTGLMSMRALIFEALPNTGIPDKFDSWDEYRAIVERFVEEDVIKKPDEIWWDVRINHNYGTLEVRIPDSQHRIESVEFFISFVRELVLYLADSYSSGINTEEIRKEIIVENKWRGVRYGIGAEFLEPKNGKKTIKEKYSSLRKKIEESLDKTVDLDIEDVIEMNGAEEQIKIYEEKGMRSVLELLKI